MNKEQLIGLLRHLLPFIGGIATARGYIAQESWAIFSEQLLQLAGPVITIAGLVWSYLDKTDKAIVEKAIAIPEVSRIECAPTKEGHALADSVPSQDVVAENVSVTIKPASMSARRVVQTYPRSK
jgi:hypothetical protein